MAKYHKDMSYWDFGGRIFHVNSYHGTKMEARKKAEWIRKQGSRARVMKVRGKWATLMS